MPNSTTTTPEPAVVDSADREGIAAPTADQFAERLLMAGLGAIEVYSFYLGDKLGWYRSLAADGPATPQQLAERTGTDARYAREWLEQQAVYGILTVDTGTEQAASTDGTGRRYALPPAVAEVLTDVHSLAYVGPLPRMFMAVVQQLPALLAAYRNGGGVTWAQFGDDVRTGQADMNRPWFEHQLPAALAGVPEVHAVLSRPEARIADVGCGAGWSTIAIARAYPGATVTGIDIDEPSVELARQNASAAGLTDRLSFRCADGSELAADGSLDAAFLFECLHDMPRPVEVLDAVRRSLKPDGTVVVMDEAVADDFTAPGDVIERLMYGFSLLVCLPDGLSSPPSAGTGTVMRRGTLEGYAREAGFGRVEVLPIEDFGFFRFYRLHQ